MVKRLSFFLAAVIIIQYNVKAGTFVSNASAPWNMASTWSFSGDADGIPDNDDDVTILASHTVSVASTGHKCKNLTVNGIIDLTSGCNLTIYGNYTLNGSETGSNGSLSFLSTSGTIAGAGTFGTQVRCSFVSASYTINPEVQFLKSVACNAGNGTITNKGYVRFSKIYGSTEHWINATGSTLEFSSYDIGSWNLILDASASGNTVIYSNSSGSVNMKTPVGGVYHHLTITGTSSAKKMTGDIQVNGNLTLSSSGTLSSMGYNIGVKGNVSKVGGTLSLSGNTTFTFNGTTAQVLTNSSSALSFINLTFDNPTTVSFSGGINYTVSGTFTVAQGTANVGTNLFTLLSNAGSTAIIGPSNGAISGSLKIQRFISARSAGYSDMAHPFSGQTVGTAWDTDLLLVYTYAPPYQYPSIFSYDETIWDYVPVTSSSTVLTLGKGYEVYLDSDGSQTTFNATTLHLSGNPYLGTLDISSTVTDNNDGWNLVGNPYHAGLDWDALHATTSNISPDIMFYDETVDNGDGTFGNFVTATTGSGVVIAPEQGFWVQATSNSPTLTFTENIKSSSTSSSFRSMPLSLFGLKLTSMGKTGLSSSASFRFSLDPQNETKGDLPVKKQIKPEAPILASVSQKGKPLMIQLLNSGNEEIEIPLHFSIGQDGLYTISPKNIDLAAFEGYTCVSLVDHKNNTVTDLAQENYQFYAEKEKDQSRFSLKLSKTGGCTASPASITNNGKVEINCLNENAVIGLDFDQTTEVKITMTNLVGQELIPARTVNTTSEKVYLPLPHDFSGIYLVNVYHNGTVTSRKLFK